MQIILASAKIMRERCPNTGIRLTDHTLTPLTTSLTGPLTEPLFQQQALQLAQDLSHKTANDLSELFSCSPAIGEQNRQRFAIFGTDEAELMPAVLAYYGQAYKHLKADTLSALDLDWANDHLWISSCLYGLLRPYDGINTYRMEGGFSLPSTNGQKVNDFWKERLTDTLINATKADDGILIYLDTEEFRSLFDWKKVIKEITVIEPEFHVLKQDNKQETKQEIKHSTKSGNMVKLTTPSVWAKTCRGAMTRFIIEHRITSPDDLKAFSYEGFTYSEEYSAPGHPNFIKG